WGAHWLRRRPRGWWRGLAWGRSRPARRCAASGSGTPLQRPGRPASSPRSMLELPFSGEHHRHAVFVGGGDDFVVPKRAARLGDRGDAAGGNGVEPVPEREEGVARRGPALGPAGRLLH